MNKPSIFQNTAVVTVIACLERALGFLYRIVLARLLGAEGLGIYQIALSHFFLFQTVVGGGIPVSLSRTVSRLNAENQGKHAGGALLSALLLAGGISLPILGIFLPLIDKIPLFAAEAPVLKILLGSLTATAAYMAIKGFFWGNKQFLSPALFEIVEEISTVLLGVVLLTSKQNLSSMEGACRAAWAHSIAAVVVCAIACITLLLRRIKRSSPVPFLKPLTKAAAPITAVRFSATLVNAAVSALLPAMLIRAGMPQSDALQAFGVATGMVMPLVCIPLTMIGSLAIVLVPELAEDHQKRNAKQLQEKVEKGVFFALALPCLLIPLFMAVGEPTAAFLYQNDLAGEMLPRIAFLLLPMSVNAILVSILNSLGFERHTFAFSLIGSAALLVCILFLPDKVGVYAYPIGTFVSLMIEVVCGWRLLKKHCPLPRRFYRKALLCIGLTAPLGLVGQILYKGASLFLGAWQSTLCAALLLSFSIVAFGVLFRLLPPIKNRKKFLHTP